MPTINPWINFNGNAEEAFTFYQSIFGGEFKKIIRFKDLASEDFPIPQEESEKVMLIALSVGEHHTLMGNDVPSFMGTVSEQEHRSKIALSADSKEEADAIFQGLSVGGHIEGAMSEGPWGSYAGMLRDKFGIEWIIEYYPTTP